jgi:hypothetical protein
MPRFSSDGAVILEHTESLASKLVALSKKHVEVYRVLKALTTSSVYGALVVELGTIALSIAGNHGVKLPGFPLQAGDGQALNQAQGEEIAA